jgi:hypothetical protein
VVLVVVVVVVLLAVPPRLQALTASKAVTIIKLRIWAPPFM